VRPVASSIFGPALGQLVLVGFLACAQPFEGLVLLSGLAEVCGSRFLSSLGLVERALPMMGRPFRSARQGRGQALAIAFAVEAIGYNCRNGRGCTAFRLLFQRAARLFGCSVQTLLLLVGAQARRHSLAQSLLGFLLCAAAQAQQDGQVGCHGWLSDVASVDR
jgi:hypothetical protein